MQALLGHGWLPIVALCLLVYGGGLDNGFHYDDEHSILRNPHIRDLGQVPAFFVDPRLFSVDADKAMYRPVLLVSYALNYRFGGYEVRGYHIANLALHAASACLVWQLAGALGLGGATPLLAGLLFAAHPLATEPVNYVSSRSESLAGCLYLLGLLTFVLARQRGGRGWSALSCGALALGLLSKDTAITLPAVVLLWDLIYDETPLAGRLGAVARRHAPYWGIAAAYLGVVSANGFLGGSLAHLVRPLHQQLLTQAKALVYYVGLLAWPVPLCVEHQFTVAAGLTDGAVLGALALWGSAGLLLLRVWRRRASRLAPFLVGWGLLALLPVLVMPLNVLVNERRLYLPAAAWCMGLAALLQGVPVMAGLRTVGHAGLSGWAARWGGLVAGLLVAGYGLTARARTAEWRDDLSLWESAARRAPAMPRVHLYLGNAHKDVAQQASDLTTAGRHWEAAAREYQRALQLDPQGELGRRALGNLGSVYFSAALADPDPASREGHLEAAEQAYRQALGANPRYADGMINLGSVCYERARSTADASRRPELLQQAIEWYGRALGIEPNHAEAWANLGLACYGLGDLARAQQAYQRAYGLNPADAALLNNMGNLHLARLRQSGGVPPREGLERAAALYREALRLSPGYAAPAAGLRQVEALLRGAP